MQKWGNRQVQCGPSTFVAILGFLLYTHRSLLPELSLQVMTKNPIIIVASSNGYSLPPKENPKVEITKQPQILFCLLAEKRGPHLKKIPLCHAPNKNLRHTIIHARGYSQLNFFNSLVENRNLKIQRLAPFILIFQKKKNQIVI